LIENNTVGHRSQATQTFLSNERLLFTHTDGHKEKQEQHHRNGGRVLEPEQTQKTKGGENTQQKMVKLYNHSNSCVCVWVVLSREERPPVLVVQLVSLYAPTFRLGDNFFVV
jgi:hypothetical protein